MTHVVDVGWLDRDGVAEHGSWDSVDALRSYALTH
jgi:hypothetical protein